jgi:RNA polymerase sigma-70 factor (ECF subfamily)
MNESTAISLCFERDPRGFEYLVRQYRREAYYHAIGFLGNATEAEDACQESFAKAYANIAKLTSLPAFYPWFYQILRNGCLNRIRARRPEEEYDDVHTSGDSAETSPQQALEGDDQNQSVWSALEQLKPAFREILILKHMHNTSYADISELLNIPRGTVMSRLYHARLAFQHMYNANVSRRT